MAGTKTDVRSRLLEGLVIPASPLALDSNRRLDERRQRALIRYYSEAGAGALAVAVHTTQFALRDPKFGLFRPLLELFAEEFSRLSCGRSGPMVKITGICGPTAKAEFEATIARNLKYDAGLLNLGAQADATEDELLNHCERVSQIMPVIGFYLQPAAGGRYRPFSFWRRFAEIKNVVAINIAPFNRYQTLDVIRAIAESGREDIALYTGNDDNIVADLLTPFRFEIAGIQVERRIVGGLLGQWAVWTKRAVQLHEKCRRIVKASAAIPAEYLRLNAEITDANSAIFDVANAFAGCIPGIHEVLRRQRLLSGTWCLDPDEVLSPGQSAGIDRVCRAYPHLSDDAFVAENIDRWLA